MTIAAQAAPTAARGLELLRGALPAWLTRAAALCKDLGPYAAIELLLPGGSLIVLLLWLYRRYRRLEPLLAARAD